MHDILSNIIHENEFVGVVTGEDMYRDTVKDMLKNTSLPHFQDIRIILKNLIRHYDVKPMEKELEQLIDSPKEYFRVNYIPNNNTILSDIYRYTHIKEYIGDMRSANDMPPTDVWYATNMHHLENILMKSREEITEPEYIKLFYDYMQQKSKEEEWD